VADPEGPLVQWLIDNDRIVYRPEVLRHFAAGGDYGLVDQRDALRSFARPVLVLSGAEDRTTPAASAHDLAHAIPGAQEIVIPNAAHPRAGRAAGGLPGGAQGLSGTRLTLVAVGRGPFHPSICLNLT